MSAGNGEMPQEAQGQPGQPQMMKINCAQCKSEMLVRTPAFRLFNFPDASGFVFTHTRVDKCPECGVVYICMLSGIDGEGHIMLAWTPVQTKESAIVAPTDKNMQSALEATSLANKLKTN